MQIKIVFSFVIFLVLKGVVSAIDKKNVEINCQSSSMKSILDVLAPDVSDGEVIFKMFSENSKSAENKTADSNLKLDEGSCLKNGSSVNGEFNDFFCDGDTTIAQHSEDDDIVGTASQIFKEVEQRDFNKSHIPLEILTPATLLAVVPPFDPRNSEGISEDCRRQTDIYFKELKKLTLWALKMYDSSAKIPSGFLNGNINQYGDIDQCLSVRSEGSLVQGRGSIIRGKYCLSSLQLTISSNASSSVKDIFRLVHSHHSFKSELRDPGHRVPRFSSINWALCVPSGCSHEDVQRGVEHVLSGHVNGAAVTAEVLVEPEMCQVEEEENLPRGTVFVGSLFMCFIILAVIATVVEIKGKQSHEMILSFSLRRNLKTLFSTRRSEDDVQAVHGIRCLNALMLLLSHKSMAIFFVPFINRTHMVESLGHSWSVVGRAASLYTDPFIMFSGLLTCYSFIGRASKKQELSITQEYLGRLFRIVPTLGALILFCTWVLPEMGSGPQWPLVISHHAHICKQHWWKNLLFVHNYFGFENMCLTHTHHIGIDTQLFAFGVPIALWLATRPNQLKNSVIILVALALLSTGARFYVSYTMELANFVYFGTSVSQLFRTANYMYILPAHRATVYIIGLLLGLLLRHKPVTRLTGFQLKLGWFSCLSLFLLAFLSPAGMGRMGYQYSVLPAACYAAFTPIAWCMFFGWIVYTQHHGYNNFVGRMFCWKGFLIWTRLSYAVYLTQFPVFFYYVGITRNPGTYSFIGHMVDMKELIVVLFYSIVLTLLFDLPFQNIKRLVCKPKQKVAEVNKQELPVATSETKFNDFGESIAIVERNSNKKLWKAD